MLTVPVPEGAIFYGQPRRRMEVRLDSSLRAETERLAMRLHELQNAGVTPPAVFAPHCQKCSLKDVCLPEQTASARPSVYLQRTVAALLKEK
jgi:CRISPR-associated exonuclease Cas4